MSEPYVCDARNAEKIHDWILHRGGVFIWKSINLSNPGGSWSTPATIRRGDCEGSKAAEGSPDDILPYPKPNWQCGNEPRHITSLSDVVVATAKEVKRFHVAIRMAGLSYKVTVAGTQKIRTEVDKAAKNYSRPAWYQFDYGSEKNCVIFVEDTVMPLMEWAQREEEFVC